MTTEEKIKLLQDSLLPGAVVTVRHKREGGPFLGLCDEPSWDFQYNEYRVTFPKKNPLQEWHNEMPRIGNRNVDAVVYDLHQWFVGFPWDKIQTKE